MTVTRRTLLTAGTALGAGLTLAGCQPSGSGNGPGGTGSGAPLTMPTFVPFKGPKPDLPGDAARGVPDGYLSYPDPPASTGRVPLKLSRPVELLVQGGTTPIAMDKNAWWQQVNTDVGAEVRLNAIPSTEYLAKFQTVVAGNSLSEISQIVTVPQMPAMLKRMFTDLTDLLSGDAVTKYPNLANIPPAAWQVARVDGRLWGIPQPRIVGGNVMLTQGDLLARRGIDLVPAPADGEAFLDMVRELNDPKNQVFAIGQVPQDWTVPLILESLGAPNGWKVEGGTWRSAYELPEYERALEIVTGMYAEHLFHPNSFSDPGSSHVWFDAGTTALLSQNFANWQAKAKTGKTPVGVVVMPRWDGGGAAAKHLGAPAYTAPVGLARTDDAARTDELLRLLDYLASPFGTIEFLNVNYGVQSRQWTIRNGDVVVDPKAPDENPRGLNYAGSAIWRDLYTAGQPDVTKMIHAYCAEHLPTGVANPSLGRYSETAVTKAPAAGRKLNDLQGEIIQGRAKLSSWAAAVKEWKTAAGDAMAREYAEAAG